VRIMLCPLVLRLMSPSLASRSPSYLVADTVYERPSRRNAARFSKKVTQFTVDGRSSAFGRRQRLR
jgi:hypothetical protein